MQDNRSVVVCFRVEGNRFYITSQEKSHVYGDIDADGIWTPTSRATSKIIEIVKKVERDPIAYARTRGLKTGRC